MTNHAAPLLSLIIGARNDSYMGDLKWRLNTCLYYLADSLETIGRSNDVEVVVCDWGSPAALHGELDLSQAACSLTRFIVVAPEFAAMAQLDSPFPIPIVQNVAIQRRADKAHAVPEHQQFVP
jgi:predicted benzoate:H+ symporter BenE